MSESTSNADADGDCTCPICLESLTRSERETYPLPCINCDFNFCSNCVENFCEAASHDYQIASDGSRQVKITVACPQCRSKYPVDLEETILMLRSAHALATAILTKETVDESGEDGLASASAYKLISDSDLSASQLARKSEFSRQNVRNRLEAASLLYEKAVSSRKVGDTEPAKRRRAEAKAVWTALLDQLPPNSCRCDASKPRCDGSCGSRNSIEVVLQSECSVVPAAKPQPVVLQLDETLFQGFDEFMNRDEKLFLTDLFTGGDARGVAQAALIMNGVRRLALSPSKPTSGSNTISRGRGESSGPPMTKQQLQKHIDHIEQTKLQFPLPNHMPGYFLIPAYSYREGYMTLRDQQWDGTITPSPRSKRVFETVYGPNYTPPGNRSSYPLTVAVVHAVRGPIGRLGLRRGDVITHVNDAEWNGSATDLQNYIYDCHQGGNGSEHEISITVNANIETCEFLRVRAALMAKKAREQKTRTPQQKQQRARAARGAAADKR